MASSSGTSSGSGSGSSSMMTQNSGSEKVLQALMDQRKRKRMVSNRESARRSRMRKQKHLDDLASKVSELTSQNHQILKSLDATTQRRVAVEAENSVLRAQLAELSHRLDSLNEIIDFLNAGNGIFGGPSSPIEFEPPSHSFFSPMAMPYTMVNHPIMASADMLHY